MLTLPLEIGILHIAAVCTLFGAWLGLRMLLAAFGRGTLNMQLALVRRRWMSESYHREIRVPDAVLLGHIINSVAFFGSATLIVLAGLIGTIVNLQSVYEIVIELPFAEQTNLELFACKLAILALVLTLTFFSFTYALRKLVYTTALIGGMPTSMENEDDRQELLDASATVLTEAVKSFNNGIRGFYFAVAALLLVIGPVASMAGTACVVLMLVARQTRSKTARAIEQYVDVMARMPPDR